MTKMCVPIRSLLIVLSAGMLLSPTALAELANDTLLGAGARDRPAYDGSNSQRVEPVPVIRYLGDRWFARSTQGVLEGGARMLLAPGLHLGVQLAYESGRITSDSDFLQEHNVAGLKRGASYGAQVEWDQKFGIVPITLLGRVRENIDSERGLQGDLRLSVGVLQAGPVGAGLFTQGTWANAKSTNYFYGISSGQTVATGLPAYSAGSGLLFHSYGLLWSVDLSKNWVIVGSAEARRLHGDAARSPLAERTTNRYLSAGIAYRF